MRSYKKPLSLGILAAFAAALGWWALLPEPLAKTYPLGGRLELVAGDVQVLRDETWRTLGAGSPLASSERVRTGEGARALVRLQGGASAFVGERTELALTAVGVLLATGRLWLDVPKVPEPGVHDLGVAKLSASDAGLSIERREDALEIYVARGLAVVDAKKARREIHAGERALVSAEGALSVEPLAYFQDWTGGMADHGLAASMLFAGSGRVYAVDREARPGAPTRALSVQKQNVATRIADGVAETEVDQTFFNASDRDVEGYYWFTVPERALVTGFLLETDGKLVEGEIVERNEARAQYHAAMASSHDPALLEWIDDHTYRARIFPVRALGSRRVVLRYIETVSFTDGRLRWVYPLANNDPEPQSIDELSLTVDLGALGKDARIATLSDARIEQGGRYVTMRRSEYLPRADFQLEIVPKTMPEPLRVTRFDSAGDRADFVMLRWLPDVDWDDGAPVNADIVLSLDVSAGGDDLDRPLKLAVAEAVLKNLSGSDHFAVMTTDVIPRIIYPEKGLATATPENVAEALARMSAAKVGGATDLAAMFDPGLSRLHDREQPALVYVGDGLSTSGELKGAAILERLRRSLEGSRARLFAVGVGPSAHHALLSRLSSVGGGAYFRVERDEVSVREALRLMQAVKTKTITDLSIDVGVGLDEPLSSVAGKISRGQELTLLARTHHDLPSKATVRGRFGGKDFVREYELVPARGAATSLVPRLWANELAHRLMGAATSPEEVRGKVVSLALDYGLVTPFSSILALESEEAYSRMGITRRKRAWDRLPVEHASFTPRTPLESTLAYALAPVTMLTGCSETQDAPAAAAAHVATPPSAVPALGMASPKMESAPEPNPAQLENQMIDRVHDSAVARARESYDSAPQAYARAARAPGPSNDAPRSIGQRRERRSAGVSATPAPVRQTLATGYISYSACSDLAARPLSDRLAMWQRRLQQTRGMDEALFLYDRTRAACEVQGQREHQLFLSLLVPRAESAHAAERLFAHFAHDVKATHLLARLVIRRTLDPFVSAAARRALDPNGVDWPKEDLTLLALASDEARITHLRDIELRSPSDLDAQLRLVRLYLRTGRHSQAVALCARFRERGLLSPVTLRALGDLEFELGQREEALRTYTEIVEFEPESEAARRLVGDVLLARGYFDVAYRQYHTLTELTRNAPESLMRLALAAAGTGRTDEALRILRGIVGDDVDAKADDPRQEARLLRATLLSRLIAETNDQERVRALGRELRQLNIVEPGGRMVLLTWNDLAASLGSATVDADIVDASRVGLFAIRGSAASLEHTQSSIHVRSERTSQAKIPYTLHELSFDGTAFQVKVLRGEAG